MHIEVDSSDDGDVAVKAVHDGLNVFVENVDWTVVIDFSGFGRLVVGLEVGLEVTGIEGEFFKLATGTEPGKGFVGVELVVAAGGVSFQRIIGFKRLDLVVDDLSKGGWILYKNVENVVFELVV